MPESFGIVEGGSPVGGVVQQTASTGRVTRPDPGVGLLDEQVDQRTAGLVVAGGLDCAAGTGQVSGGLGEPEPGPLDLGRGPSPGESPVGAENAVTSCDLHVLVHETAEPVASEGLDGRAGGRGSRPCGRALIK